MRKEVSLNTVILKMYSLLRAEVTNIWTVTAMLIFARHFQSPSYTLLLVLLKMFSLYFLTLTQTSNMLCQKPAWDCLT